VRLLLDISASMTAGTGKDGVTKFDYARKLAAALVYVGLVRLDSLLLQPFSARLSDPFLASGGRHRFQPAEIYLRELKAGGKTSYLETARQFLSEYPQRGLVIVVSDFLDDGDCFHPLQYIADFGHELFLVQLWSEEDREPTGEGELELIDAESSALVKITVDEEARRAYTRAFDAHAAEIRKLALRNGGRYSGFSTAVPLEDAIFGPLMMAPTA